MLLGLAFLAIFRAPVKTWSGARLARSAACTVLLALLPAAAWAEVMDKEPTVLRLWTWALLLGALGFVAWRRHPALGAFAALVAAVLVWGFHFELADPHVGPAILQEAGPGYVVQAYAAMLVCAAFHLAGVSLAGRQGVMRWRSSPARNGKRS